MKKLISTKMNDLDLCIEVISGYVNHCVAFVIEYFGIPGVNSRICRIHGTPPFCADADPQRMNVQQHQRNLYIA